MKCNLNDVSLIWGKKSGRRDIHCSAAPLAC